MLSGIPAWSELGGALPLVVARASALLSFFARLLAERVRAFAPFAIFFWAWQPRHSVCHSKLYLPHGQVQSPSLGALDPGLAAPVGR
eukprot:4324793-Heterocapsa_arctica.AAC.1